MSTTEILAPSTDFTQVTISNDLSTDPLILSELPSTYKQMPTKTFGDIEYQGGNQVEAETGEFVHNFLLGLPKNAAQVESVRTFGRRLSEGEKTWYNNFNRAFEIPAGQYADLGLKAPDFRSYRIEADIVVEGKRLIAVLEHNDCKLFEAAGEAPQAETAQSEPQVEV